MRHNACQRSLSVKTSISHENYNASEIFAINLCSERATVWILVGFFEKFTYICRPASLMCGTVASHRVKNGQSGQMGALFGESANGEAIVMEHPRDWQPKFFREFMVKNLKFLYLNTLRRESAVVTRGDVQASFEGGVATFMNAPLMKKGGAVMQQGEDFFVPAPWLKEASAVAYSSKGGKFCYDARQIMGWSEDAAVSAERLDHDGLSGKTECYALREGMLEVELAANTALVLECR
jgi:hypothetical protein